MGEKIQWEKEKSFLTAKLYVLNENQLILEKEKQVKDKKESVQIGKPST